MPKDLQEMRQRVYEANVALPAHGLVKFTWGNVSEVCRELGISTATFYKWRAKYGGMDTSMMARMKELEAENARLKKMYIEEKLKAEIVTEALAKKW